MHPDTCDGEDLGDDNDGDITGYSCARKVVTISYSNLEVFTTLHR
jgi:hypothetical protein